jgi:PAS domain S-box-containing protein
MADEISGNGAQGQIPPWSVGFSDAIINSLPGVFYLYDQDGRLVRWNKKHEDVLGYSAQELHGKHVLDFFESDDREVIAKGVERVFAEGKAEAEARMVTKNGEKIPYYFTGVVVMLGGRPHFLGLGIDITERKKSEVALRESEARAREWSELFPEIVFESDVRGNLTYANQIGFEKFGYTKRDLEEGLHILQMLAPDERARGLQDLGELLAGKTKVGGEYTAIRKDGTTFPTTVYASPVTRAGKTVGIRGIMVDVTERVCTERSLSARADRIMHFHKCLLGLSRVDLTDLAAQMRQITEADAQAMKVERVSIWFFNDDDSAITCEDLYTLTGGTHASGLRIEASQYPRYFAALRESRTIAATDACGDAATSEFAEGYLRPLGISSMLDAPVRLHGRIVGVVCHEHIGPMRAWLPEEQDFAASIADMVSLAMEAVERRRAEDALGRSEEEFRQLVENVPIGIYRSTPEGKMLMANPTMVRMLGYDSLEDLAQQNLDSESSVHGYRRAVYKERIEREGRIVGLESVWTRSDGSLIHVRENARAIFDEQGRAKYYEGTIEDITEQKWASEALKQEAEFRRATIERASEGLCVCHETKEHPFTKFTVWNERMTEITGYTMPDINARGWYQSVYPDPELRARAMERMSRMRIGDDLVGEEWEITRADGAKRIVSISTSVISVTDETVHVLALMQDVTERKRAEAELREYQEHLKDLVKARTAELEETNKQLQDEIRERKQLEADLIKARESAESANRAKSSFLANMSHGIRTPMNAILGYAQILDRDPGIDETQREYIEIINRSGEHLLGLINDILEMSKIEAGRATLNVEEFDFSAMLDDLEAMFRARTSEKKVSLQIVRNGLVPRQIYGDSGKIREVMINLLGNALKFTDSGGITVRVASPEVSGNSAERILSVEVEDTGYGIAPEEMRTAFEPFEQTRCGRFQRSGTGLGLPISREYARMMGGDLVAESVVGKGSRFLFTFRARAGGVPDGVCEQATARRQVVGLAPGRPCPRLLVVDDDEASREALTLHLEMIGFAVRQARDGAEAISVFSEWRPDAVLMDLWMPEMGGLEATRRIKAMPGGSETAVLTVTASVLEESEREATEAGSDGFIRKPFKKEQVFDELKRVLGVEYVYQEQAWLAEEDALEDYPDEVADMPAELAGELAEAAKAGDGARLRRLIEDNLDCLSSDIRENLPALANNYEYSKIIRMLGRAKDARETSRK